MVSPPSPSDVTHSSTPHSTPTGEVIPQAICSRYGLMVGAYSAWFVRLLMTLTMPISWPIAKLLDLLLGSEHSVRTSPAWAGKGNLP